jgi:hypothetical protein
MLSLLLQKETHKFNFKVKDKFGRSSRICEAAMLIILGLIDSNRASEGSTQWKLFKAQFSASSSAPLGSLNTALKANAKGAKKTLKRNNAESYIKMLVHLYFSDSLPTKEGAEGAAVLPYETVNKLFQEYEHYCSIYRIALEERAKLTLFKNVYNKLKSDNVVRLLGCKGNRIFK